MPAIRHHSSSHIRRLFILLNIGALQQISSLSVTTDVSNMMSPAITAASPRKIIITISEKIWRAAASQHSRRIKHLLQPGLTPLDHTVNSGRRNRGNRHRAVDDWTALDPINPIYNFLIEYYGLKGAKGPRRLARWAPDPKLLLGADDDKHGRSINFSLLSSSDAIYEASMEASHGLGGILLENANLGDLGGTLHIRGSVPVPIIQSATATTSTSNDVEELHGILYNPAVFYNRHIPLEGDDDDDSERRKQLKTIAPFQWYSSILQTTLNSDPVLHCYGLHEWAMQYHPDGAPPPPSAKYQSSLNLRVSRETINETVERKGVHCTHVDALRFFAPAAGPLNHHGAELRRTDQLRLEQAGCVHAHMDLLKICLKLQGFVDPALMGDVLEVALAARTLDVEASPYDATAYGAGIVPIETNEGRKMYREKQILLMQRAEHVRRRLLNAYEVFMNLAFHEELLGGHLSLNEDAKGSINGRAYVAPERHAKAEPGGLPWRKNLIEK